LEGLIQQPLDTSSGEQDRDLSRAYQELQMQLEYLMDSLQLRVREVEEVREQNQELSLQISQTRKDLESTLSSQEEVHAETLKHLATLEQAHTDLIREYRDLNHRFIQFRHQGTSPAPAAPPPTDGSATPPSPDTTPLDMS
jgi:predicted  nucleic acid-binding Zn-ribbon protein